MSIAALFVAGLVAAAPVDTREDLLRVESYELKVTTKLFERFFEAGKPYYFGSYRKEAIHFFRKCLEVRPNHRGMNRFVNLLQDYDNPAWKKKKWRSPKTRVDAAFRKKVQSCDRAHVKTCVRVGTYAAKFRGDELWERARASFVRALELHRGPYEVDSKGRIDLGGGVEIGADSSTRLIEADLVKVNGRLYLRDSMLRSLPDVSQVVEARGDHVVVRTLASEERAAALVPLLEAVWVELAEFTGQEPTEPLGLFVFPDPETYRAYCDESGHATHRMANGFAHGGDGYAVTYAQTGLERVAAHEAAHLFHFFAFGSSMPSWYDEGFATTFGGEGTFDWRDGALVVARPMSAERLRPLLTPDGWIGVAELLKGNAVDYINRMDGSGPRFYAASWALYTFLRTTEERRFRDPFDEWEGFCLGAGYVERTQGEAASPLFDRLFADVASSLDDALRVWIEEASGG